MKQKGTRSDHHEPANIRNKETTRDERIRVIALRDAGKSWREIGRLTEIDFRTCQGIYKRARANGTPTNRNRRGRPPIFNLAEKERLREFVTRDKRTRRLPWQAIIEEMGYACSVKTLRDVMASMGYHKRLPRKKWGIRPDNLIKRVRWCQERLHWTYDDWFRTVWTDESIFNTAGFGHRPWVTRRPEEEYHPDCLDETWESGRKSTMIWGAFCGGMKSELVFTPAGVTISSRTYRDHVLDPHLIPFWHRTCEEYGWTQVVEDNAPGHKGLSIICRQINEVESVEWPAQSPDLNLIEALWADIETELGETFGLIRDIEVLKMMVRNAWNNITVDRLDGLIRSMPRRLEAVIAARGHATKY